MSSKKTLVLDLDETLIHSVITPKQNPKLAKQADFHFQLNGDQFYVFKRPGLDPFMKYVFQNFDNIGFWTTGMACYAKLILKNILTLPQAQQKKMVFIFTRNRCSHDQWGYYKPLESVWKYSKKFTPRNTIMLDNTPMVMRENLDNGIICPDFNTTNIKTDKYLPWLKGHMARNLKKSTPLKFVQQTNRLAFGDNF